MLYRVIKADREAARYIKGISLLSNEDRLQEYGCVPNGAVGISIVLNGSCYIKVSGRMEAQPKMFIYGLVQQVQWHTITPGYREITIVFHPHYLQLFLKERLSDLGENAAVELNNLFSRSDTDRLYENLATSASDEEIVKHTCSFLKNAIRQTSPEQRTEAAHDLIYNKHIRNVSEVSSMLNISAIRLRELFRNNVGVSPKELIRIRRINEALRVYEHKQHSLTRLAYELDYFDQAHFIHDFKKAIGLTPRQYFSNGDLTSDFYNLGRWDRKHFEMTHI